MGSIRYRVHARQQDLSHGLRYWKDTVPSQMDSQDCPLPSVLEALTPFIKTRHDVAEIRTDLHDHLQRCIDREGSALSSVSLANPRSGTTQQTSPDITGAHKAYLNALRAHSVAQGRYDALKADLAHLPESTHLNRAVSANGPSSISDSYIPLLRQREKRRRLQLIERAYAAVAAAGTGLIDGHLDNVVKQQAGDLPTPPTQQPPTYREKPDVEARILQLKKTVLSTKRDVKQRAAMKSDDRGNDVPQAGPGGGIVGLQSALNELTGWMEQQLAIIGDVEGEVQTSDVTTAINGHPASGGVSLENIAASYDDYLLARQRIIQIISSPSTSEDLATFPTEPESVLRTPPRLRSPAETVLPYLDSLTSTKREEHSLLQDTTFLRRQIAASESETQRLLARLADESHLVHPGASQGRDWAAAAAEAKDATKEFAAQRLQAGEVSAAATAQALEGVRDVPEKTCQLATGAA
ncbi:hypothetical protein B0A55_00093 [Friedmanniomyces simplex]|uniref:Uncharacterized protein n=1 Tax=Friedmanniomyces simplex TaxID=329884 RepID=A0A4U0Y0H8_9PEZI|nr:hypothetical protein B0A55_00093 [Friedmanniomyces simplex]